MATNRFIAKNGLDNNAQTITNVATPVNTTDATTKEYVDLKLVLRVTTVTTATTISPNNITDQYVVTALASALTLNAPTGTLTNGQKFTIRIKDDGTARALTWTTTSGSYRVIGTILPITTVASKVVYVGCIYNSQDNYWDVVSVAQQG
jgi:hypothetical protein